MYLSNRCPVNPWCRYYIKHLDTIRAYIRCLYELEDCSTGGLLHIVIDDGNVEDDDITYCLNECINNPEKEESTIGKLICEEFLKLSIEQRRLVVANYKTVIVLCYECGKSACDTCWIEEEI